MDESAREIYKIGGVILDGGKILVVRKHVFGRTEYIIPGGRSEPGETPEQTLRRELNEELQVELLTMDHFGTFSEIAAFENIPITIETYLTTVSGTPKAASEIKECVWIDRDYSAKGIQLGSVLSKHVIPRLISLGKM